MKVKITKTYEMSENQLKEFMLRNGHTELNGKVIEDLGNMSDWELDRFTTHDSILDTNVSIINTKEKSLKDLARYMSYGNVDNMFKNEEEKRGYEKELKESGAICIYCEQDGSVINILGAVSKEIYRKAVPNYDTLYLNSNNDIEELKTKGCDQKAWSKRISICCEEVNGILSSLVIMQKPYESFLTINKEGVVCGSGAVCYIKDLIWWE